MKQIYDCLDRFYTQQKPLKAKWQAKRHQENGHLYLFHYHHLVLVYDDKVHKVLYQWWEVPTDKRGLDAALAYFENKK